MIGLSDTLAQAGVATQWLPLADGSGLLLLPEYGRVLGLYPPQSEQNFLWTHPDLRSVGGARQLFTASGWCNPGGDRTWLAPDREFFIRDVQRPMDTYRVPSALDPGAWQVIASEGGGQRSVTLASTMTLERLQAHDTVHLQLRKRISAAASPLRDFPWADAGMQYTGYTLTTTLSVAPPPGNAPVMEVGLWQLLQLPAPGIMLISTHGRGHARTVFGSVARQDLRMNEHLVRWHMGEGGDDAKISLKAAPLTGRAAHLFARDGDKVQDLVIRCFSVNPSGNYVDTPWLVPDDRGYAFQACRVRSGTAYFNELEYHAAAEADDVGGGEHRDVSQVWAFRGSRSVIATVACVLLGVSL